MYQNNYNLSHRQRCVLIKINMDVNAHKQLEYNYNRLEFQITLHSPNLKSNMRGFLAYKYRLESEQLSNYN